MSEYGRSMMKDGYLIIYEGLKIKELSVELNKIGSNINQIAYHVNQNGGEYDRRIMEQLVEEFAEVQNEVYKAIWGI